MHAWAVHTHIICLWGGDTGYSSHFQPWGNLRHREGHLLTRGLCLAELRRTSSEHQTKAEEDSEPHLRA